MFHENSTTVEIWLTGDKADREFFYFWQIIIYSYFKLYLKPHSTPTASELNNGNPK